MAENLKKNAVFLDRDGTIIDDVGYIKDPSLICFLPGALEALTMLQDAGFALVVVSNQSGIARGIISLEELQAVRQRFCELLKNNNIILMDYLFCPHHPSGSVEEFRKKCDCRKPAPGMLLDAADRHGIDLKNSWMIGDKNDDVRAGLAAGTRTIRLADPDKRHSNDVSPDFYAANLLQAVKIITGTYPV
jgi:D,D-heptose 1,7-bisphosphate phosphatase